MVSDEREGFWGRLSRARRILFPPMHRPASNAQVAKLRLKMILISDRWSVNDEAKRKTVNNIVGALADFVEIESEEKVALNVFWDSHWLGTVYYVTVPVRRLRPKYQDYSKEAEDVLNPHLNFYSPSPGYACSKLLSNSCASGCHLLFFPTSL